ncbi:MAG TPA: DUF4153 domain-containing protein [Pedobacter sp.]|jgi:hypothetical protein
MKFPSVSLLVSESKSVIYRYPFEVFSAFCGCCAATALIELEANDAIATGWCVRIMMAANIALLLTLSATLFGRSRMLSLQKKRALSVIAILLSLVFLFAFDPMKRESDIIRFFLVSFGLHLLVAFAAFAYKNQINAFWQFNKTIFLRILASALYSGVLYVGLAAAIGAMNFLFNFDFESDTFSIMAVWIFGMFQTLFFLAGVPELEHLNEDESYPKGLKLFTQYVLIPLATVYVLILLSYELKILIQWNMPKGLVSSLILGYAVFGILAFLLIYPLRNQEEHKWIKTYSKSFFYLMVPLLILLYLAIFVRVEKYGITESRYFLVSLAVWLSFVTLYFISSKRQNIVIIPLSLCVITLLAVYGPLSAFNIAEISQLSRLQSLLNKNKLLSEGKLKSLNAKKDTADIDEITESSRYLVDKYGIESMQPIIKEDLSRVSDSIKTSLQKQRKGRGTYRSWNLREGERLWLSTHYNLSLEYRGSLPQEKFREVSVDNESLTPLHHADFMIHITFYDNNKDRIELPAKTFLQYDLDTTGMQIKIGNDSLKTDFAYLFKRIEQHVAVQKTTNPNQTNHNLPRTALTEHFELNGYDLTLLINSIGYSKNGTKYEIQSGGGVLLLKKK